MGDKARDAILLAAGISDEKNKTSRKLFLKIPVDCRKEHPAAIEHLANADNVMAIIAITGTAEAMDAAIEADKWKVPLVLITPKEE